MLETNLENTYNSVDTKINRKQLMNIHDYNDKRTTKKIFRQPTQISNIKIVPKKQPANKKSKYATANSLNVANSARSTSVKYKVTDFGSKDLYRTTTGQNSRKMLNQKFREEVINYHNNTVGIGYDDFSD